MPVNWTAENDRKLLLNLITTLSTKDINAETLASLFPGATPKAILERVAKLRRELKATTTPTPTTATATATATAKAATTAPATTVTTVAATTKPTTKPTTATPVTFKPATTSPTTKTAATAKTTATGRKRGRQVEEGDATEDVVVKKRGRGRIGEGEGHGEGQGVDEGVVVKSEGCGRDEWDGEMG